MKNLVFFLVCTFSIQFCFAQPAWEQLNNFPEAGQFTASFTTINAPYVIRDLSMYRYVRDTDTWEQKNNLPNEIATTGHEGFEYNGIGYIFGKELAGNHTGVIWEYNESNDSWIQITSHDFGDFGLYDLDASVFVAGSKAYILTPTGGNNFRSYDFVSQSWELLEPYPHAVVYDTKAVSVNDRHYVIFVNLMPGMQPYLYEYDIPSNSWIRRADYIGTLVDWFPTGVFGIDSFLYAGVNNLSPNFYRYDISNDSWLQIESPNLQSAFSASFMFNGKGYIVGGFNFDSVNPIPLDVVWQFSPELLSVEEGPIWRGVNVFPSPVRSRINLSGTEFDSSYQITNTHGQILMEGQVDSGSILVSNLFSGMYFISIVDKNGVRQVKKFLKL